MNLSIDNDVDIFSELLLKFSRGDDVRGSTILCYCIYLEKNINESTNISPKLGRIAELLQKWLKTTIDQKFYHSSCSMGFRSNASREILNDFERFVEEISEKSNKVNRKSLEKRKKFLKRHGKSPSTSSSEEIEEPPERAKYMSIFNQQRLMRRSSSSEGSVGHLGLSEADEFLKTISKRDALLIVVKLIMKISKNLDNTFYTNLVDDLISWFGNISENIPVDDFYSLSNLNLMIFCEETALIIFKEYRKCTKIDKDSTAATNRLWNLMIIVINALDKVQIAINGSLFDYFDTYFVLIEALLTEYLCATATNIYSVESCFAQLLLKPENFVLVDYMSFFNNVLTTAERIITIINKFNVNKGNRQKFYRTMLDMIIMHNKQLNPEKMFALLMAAESGMSHSISGVEVIYIATEFNSFNQSYEIINRHLHHSNFFSYKYDNRDEIVSVYLIKDVIMRLSWFIGVKAVESHGGENWIKLFREIVQCQVAMFQDVVFDEFIELEQEEFNEKMFDIIKELLQHILKNIGNDEKQLKLFSFLNRQVFKILNYYSIEKTEELVSILEERKTVLNHPECSQSTSNLLGLCQEKGYLSLKLEKKVRRLVIDVIDSYCEPNCLKYEFARVPAFLNIVFDGAVRKLKDVDDAMKLKMCIPHECYNANYKIMKFLEQLVKNDVKEKYIYETIACCSPLYLIFSYLFPLLCSPDMSLKDCDRVVHEFQKRFIFTANEIIESSARNFCPLFVAHLVEKIYVIRDSLIISKHKEEICKAMLIGIHDVVVDSTFYEKLFSLPQSATLKVDVFRSVAPFLKTMRILETNIIDRLAETQTDYIWIVNELRNRCSFHDIVPLAYHKFANAPNGSLAKRRFLDVLIYCASMNDQPKIAKRTFTNMSSFIYDINLHNGITVTTWINCPKGNKQKVFAFLQYFTLRIEFGSNLRNIKMTVFKYEEQILCEQYQTDSIDSSRWYLVTFGCKQENKSLKLLLSFGDIICMTSTRIEEIKQKRNERGMRYVQLRCDFSEVYHSKILIFNDILEPMHIGSIMSMGPKCHSVKYFSHYLNPLAISHFKSIELFKAVYNSSNIDAMFSESAIRHLQDIENEHVDIQFNNSEEYEPDYHDQFVSIGGAATLILALSKAMSNGCDDVIQNNLIKLILRILSMPFIDSECWSPQKLKSVLIFLFKSEFAVFDNTTLKAIMTHSLEFIGKSDVLNRTRGDTDDSIDSMISKMSKSIIRDYELIELLMKNWDLWIKRPDMFIKFVSCLTSCAKESSGYNRRKLVPIVQLLLKTIGIICDQRTEWNVNPVDCASTIRKFVDLIIQDCDNFTKTHLAHDIWNCILMMKPASSMYVQNDEINYHGWINEHAMNRELRSVTLMKLDFDGDRPRVIREEHRFNDYDDDNETDDGFSTISAASPNSELTTSTDPLLKCNEWETCIRKELYDILIELVQLSPDNQNIANDSMCTEILIVLLTDEHDENIVNRIVRLLAAIVNYSMSMEEKFLVVKSEQFQILAAQLAGKPVGIHVANSLFSIMLNEDVDISAGLDSQHLEMFEPDLISCAILDAIFVVFIESIGTNDGGEMFIHTCSALRSAFENNCQLRQAMIDHKIDEMMIDIFRKLCFVVTDGRPDDPLLIKKSAWMAFARKIISIAVLSSITKLFQTAEKFIKLAILAHIQEASEQRNDNETQTNMYKVTCSLLFEMLQFTIDSVDVESQKHRSASTVNSPGDSGERTPEEFDYVMVPENTNRWSEGIEKFKDKLREKFQGFAPSIKCPYAKKTNRQLSSAEMTIRLKKVMTMCQVLYSSCKSPPLVIDEDQTLFNSYFNFLTRITLDDNLITRNPWFLTVQADARLNLATFIAISLFDYLRKSTGNTDEAANFFIDARKLKIMNRLMATSSVHKVRSIFAMNINVESCIQSAILEEIICRDADDNISNCGMEFLKKFDFPYEQYVQNVTQLKPDVQQTLITEYEIVSQWCNEIRKDGIRSIHLYCLTWTMRNHSIDDYKMVVNGMTKHAVMTQGEARKLCYSLLSKLLKAEDSCRNELAKFDNSLGHVGNLEKKLTNEEFQAVEVSAVQGPNGERIRFENSNNTLNPEFHCKTARYKESLESFWKSIPLFHANRSVKEGSLFTCDCTLVSNGTYYNGVIVFTDVHIYMISSETDRNVELAYSDVRVIHYRRFELKDVAYELFMNDNSSWFIAMKNESDRNIALKIIRDRAECETADVADVQRFTQDWEAGKITNFEYLMILNRYSGRTFHDFMQYPIMPHVLAIGEDARLDLQDQSNYRNLTKPIAVQNKEIESKYIGCYNMLKESSSETHTAPYHYASLYSNLATVTYYLVRLLPHAKIAIDFQDGSFDCADRIFHSVLSAYRLPSGGMATVYKELVPEMFTTPEMFLNLNEMNFGAKQNGNIVSNVDLPQWCQLEPNDRCEFLCSEKCLDYFSAYLFIIAQRHALESEIVQSQINHWIDLIFGYKQTGQSAIDSINVYHPAVYPESIPPDQTEPILYAAHKANVRNIGQVPIQLFTKPHPSRSIAKVSSFSLFSCAGIDCLNVGPQIFRHECEFREIEENEDLRISKFWQFLLNPNQVNENRIIKSSNESVNQLGSVLMPLQLDTDAIYCFSAENDYLKAADRKMKRIAMKKLNSKIRSLEVAREGTLAACLLDNGIVEFYKVEKRNFFGELTLNIVYTGSIHSSFGTFVCVDLCKPFNAVFTISEQIGDYQNVSVWDLQENRLIKNNTFIGNHLRALNVLIHTGELIAAQIDGHDIAKDFREEHHESFICKYSINGTLIMQRSYELGFVDGTVSQMKPGVGIPMIAMICSDYSIRLFESITFTCCNHIDLTKIIKSAPRSITYNDEGNLIIVDESNQNWLLSRKG